MIRKLTLGLLVSAFSLSTVVNAAADTKFLFKDNFTASTGAAQPLNGSKPAGEKSAAWIASPNLRLGTQDGHGFVTVSNAMPFIGKVALPADAASGTLVIEAEVKAVSANEKQCWVGIGLGNPPTNKVNSTWSKAGIILLLNTRGEFECHLSGDKLILLKRGRVSNYDPAKNVTLRLVCNLAAQTLTATANGSPVVTDYELANHDFTPDARFAGISGFGQKNDADLVSSFKIEIQRYPFSSEYC